MLVPSYRSPRHWYQKGKTNLDFTEARDSEWQWHQLSRMQSHTPLHFVVKNPPMALNWIIAFLTGRSQVCKTSDGRFSDPQPITSSIVEGSGIGPTLWLIVESDRPLSPPLGLPPFHPLRSKPLPSLHPLSDADVIFKYADDTNLLVPENTDCTLADEFSY